MKSYEILWHNFIDGGASLDEQLSQAEWCVQALEGLIQLEHEGTIEIDAVNSDGGPSHIMWDVLDEEKYKKAQERYDLPDAIIWEEEEE